MLYCNVYIKALETGASTNERGYYTISNIPAGKSYTIAISYMGYLKKEITVDIVANQLTRLDVELRPAGIETSTFVKTAERQIEKNETDIGLQRISIKQIEYIPKGVEADVLRTLQYIPGVQTTGDVSARYYVRGGTGDQNLVLFNGTPIYNPFHALGLFSIVDPEMINGVDFYKGGFTSEFGGRASSVLNILTKDGNINYHQVKASVSLLTAKASIEGPFPNGSFIATGRGTYNNSILKKFYNDQPVPFQFYDLSLKMNYVNPNFIKDSKFSIFGFFSGDRLQQSVDFEEEIEWGNQLLGARWFQVIDFPLFLQLQVAMSRFSGEVKPNLANVNRKKNSLTDASFQFDINWISPSSDEVRAGVQIQSVANEVLFEKRVGLLSEFKSSSVNIALFAKYKFMRFENFGLDFGARLTTLGLTKKGNFYFEPRISMTYRIFPFLGLKFAWGRYQQEITTLTDENEVITLFEPWVVIPEYLYPIRATHYIAGFDLDILDNLRFGFEAYYKDIQHLPTVNDRKFFTADPDFVDGTGEAYGFEYQANYTSEIVNFTAGYTTAWTYKKIDGWLFYPNYDTRHTVNLLLDVKIFEDMSFNIAWTFSSGKPFTQNVGYYDQYNINPREPFNVFGSYYPYIVLGDKNLGRLPTYHRLDVGISKRFMLGFFSATLEVSILNVYDRKNVFYFERETGKQVNTLPLLPSATLKIEL